MLLQLLEIPMNFELNDAKKNVEKYRFVEDSFSDASLSNPNMLFELEGYFSHSDLRISKDVTPRLDETFQTVLERLKIPKDAIKSFVYSSNEINAHCYSGDSQNTIIRFSSRLIELVDEKELEFIIGHEIGHFLFGHSCQENSEQEPDQFELTNEELIIARAQEISSDRIGFLACKEIDPAIRAIIKISSGLSNKHLRFDISAFLNQIEQTSEFQKYNNQLSTHPSMLIRCRALFWFSLNEDNTDTKTIDDRIVNDLKIYVDGTIREGLENLKEEYRYWYLVSKIIKDNRLDRMEQEVVKTNFGNERLSRLKSFLNNTDYDSSTIKTIVARNKNDSKKFMKANMPKNWERYLTQIEKAIDTELSNPHSIK